MFNVGDRVIYENLGVYTVREISRSPVDKTDERLFYVLVPMHEPECNVVVTLTTNTKVRGLISRERAEEIIGKIPELEPFTVENERLRKEIYRNALGGLDLEDYVRLIKTVMARREDFAKQKRRISDTDADYEKRAKHGLYSELAVVYDVKINEVENMIEEKIQKVV